MNMQEMQQCPEDQTAKAVLVSRKYFAVEDDSVQVMLLAMCLVKKRTNCASQAEVLSDPRLVGSGDFGE